MMVLMDLNLLVIPFEKIRKILFLSEGFSLILSPFYFTCVAFSSRSTKLLENPQLDPRMLSSSLALLVQNEGKREAQILLDLECWMK